MDSQLSRSRLIPRTVRSPDSELGRTSFRAAAICTLLVGFAAGTPVMARGGHGGFGMHGRGGFGMHGGQVGGGGELLTPAYVLIAVSKITDADVFKAAINGLTTRLRLSLAV